MSSKGREKKQRGGEGKVSHAEKNTDSDHIVLVFRETHTHTENEKSPSNSHSA